jgi:quercetin dioxygenase-like cupin family protein
MKIVSLSNAPIVPVNLEGYKMYSSSSLEVIHLCLQPGQDMPQHPNQLDVVACLIKGEVTLNMGEDKTRLLLYDTVEIEKKMDRGFTNNGTEEARLIIMKKL